MTEAQIYLLAVNDPERPAPPRALSAKPRGKIPAAQLWRMATTGDVSGA